MKLLGQVSRVYKGKGYEKHWVVVPSKLIQELGWNTGDALSIQKRGEKLIISLKKE